MQDNLKDKPLLNGINLCHVMFYFLFFDKPILPYQSMIDFYHTKFTPLLKEAQEYLPVIGKETDFERYVNTYMNNRILYPNIKKGVKFDILKKCFDLSKVDGAIIPKDLPSHAIISIFDKEINCLIEEKTLFLLSIIDYKKSEIYNQFYESNIKKEAHNFNKESRYYVDNIRIFTSLYAINSILNIHNFLECFINSIATEKRINIKNIKNNYKNILNRKTEVIQNLYCLHKSSHTNTIDKEDFDKYFYSKKELYDCIQIRNSIVHYDKDKKEEIVTHTDEWLERAKSSVKVCINEAKQIWFECAGENEIQYLNNLEIDNKKIKYQIFKEFEFNKELYEEMLKSEYPEEQKEQGAL